METIELFRFFDEKQLVEEVKQIVYLQTVTGKLKCVFLWWNGPDAIDLKLPYGSVMKLNRKYFSKLTFFEHDFSNN